MEPTIHTNDILLTDHISPKFKQIKNGDIIIAKCPTNPRENICKRVVGLPGDKVRHGLTSTIIPRGYVWVEGDNSSNSTDSRVYGAIPMGLIRSRAICKVWPLKDITMLSK